MKVLIIPSWYPSPSYPNNGSFFREQAKALVKAGADVTILSIDIPYRKTKKDFSYFKKNIYMDNGMKVFRYVFPLGILHRMPALYYMFLKLISTHIYKKEFLSEQYHYIHAHSFFIGGYIAICLKKIFECKCVITEHSSKILKDILSDKERKVLRRCVNESDYFICVSENLKSHVESITLSRGKVKVYPNMVSPLFHMEEKETSQFRFVSIGNLIQSKRMDLLIKAFINTFPLDERVSLEIIGDGEERNQLDHLIKCSKREKQITLLGSVSRKKVADILAQSHVMALVSEMETFGIVYIEAMASGNVVIGADNGGANDIIKESDGVIVHELTVDKVSEALRSVYENYKLYNPKKISEECKKKYGEDAFGKEYLHLLKNKGSD